MRLPSGLRRRARRAAVGAAAVLLFGGGFAAGWLTRGDDTGGWWPALREDETPVRAEPVRDGNLAFQPTGITCGLQWVVGTHADMEADGQYCRLSVIVTNVDSTFHDFQAEAQRIVDSANGRHPPDLDPMRIKRQPMEMTLGARDSVRLDLWFDIPDEVTAVAVAFVGDDDPSGVPSAVPPPRAPGGVLVELPASAAA